MFRKLSALILISFLILAVSLSSAVTASTAISSKPEKDLKGKYTIQLKTGIKMKYLEAGPQDGEVLILLHGLTDSSRSWSMSLPYLAKDYHVYVWIREDMAIRKVQPAAIQYRTLLTM